MEIQFRIGKKRIKLKNFDIIMLTVMLLLIILAFSIKEGSWIYNNIANLSAKFSNIGKDQKSILWTAFIFATFANGTVFIVIPYPIIIFNLAYNNPDWVLLGVVAGCGAAVGEITSYLAGRLIARSKKIKDTEYSERFYRMAESMKRAPGSVPFIVFFLALTPLPDDIILVPLGMIKYPYYKSVIPCWIGKMGMCLILAYLGWLATDNDVIAAFEITPGWEWVAPLLAFYMPHEGVNPTYDVLQVVGILLAIYLMMKVNFQKRSMRKADERIDFQKLLKTGGNYNLDDLIEKFEIRNKEKFGTFMDEFVQNHENINKMEETIHFEELLSEDIAYDQSMEFIKFIYGYKK